MEMINLTTKERYLRFCVEHPDIPIFSQPWWLDAVCPDQWEVILIEKNDKIIASFPYYKTKIRNIFTHIGMPPLTQKLGPYIVYNDADKIAEHKKIGYEHEIYDAIIDKLPISDSFAVNFDWKYKNWLPFYWRGFRQTTRYTYIIDDLDLDRVLENYHKSKRNKINKAKNLIDFKTDLSKDLFYAYFNDVIHERGESVGFSNDLFGRLYDAVYEHHSGRTFYCTDHEHNIHAINLTVWDKESAYSLIGMRKKKYTNSGGTEFLTDQRIKYVSQFVNRYDFEGSMIKGVEASYRYYGTHQTEYYHISKCNNPILRMIRGLHGN